MPAKDGNIAHVGEGLNIDPRSGGGNIIIGPVEGTSNGIPEVEGKPGKRQEDRPSEGQDNGQQSSFNQATQSLYDQLMAQRAAEEAARKAAEEAEAARLRQEADAERRNRGFGTSGQRPDDVARAVIASQMQPGTDIDMMAQAIDRARQPIDGQILESDRLLPPHVPTVRERNAGREEGINELEELQDATPRAEVESDYYSEQNVRGRNARRQNKRAEEERREAETATAEEKNRTAPRQYVVDQEGNVYEDLAPDRTFYATESGDAQRGSFPSLALGPVLTPMQGSITPNDFPPTPMMYQHYQENPDLLDNVYPQPADWMERRSAFSSDYNVGRKDKDDKRSDDERIADYNRVRAEAYMDEMFPNAVDPDSRDPEAAAQGEGIPDATFEQYEQDYESGQTEVGRYRDGRSKSTRSAQRSASRISGWIAQCFIPIEGQYVDENGNIRYTKESGVEAMFVNYMNQMGYSPDERWLVYMQLAKCLGFSPDRDGKFFNQDNAKVPAGTVEIALDNMMLSCELYGHPYGFVNKTMSLGGTRCYPVGVMNEQEARILTSHGHRFAGMDPIELMNRCANTWVNETYPDIRNNVFREEHGVAQMMVIEDMVRGICALDGVDPWNYHVPLEPNRGYQEMLAECRPEYRPNPDEDDELVQAERNRRITVAMRRRERARTRLDHKRNHVYTVYDQDVVDPDTGEIIHHKGDRVRRGHDTEGVKTRADRKSKGNKFEAACMSVANFARFAGVVGYVPIMASGIVEHAQGNILTKMANRVWFWGANGQKYKPLDGMYDEITSDEGVEAVRAMKALESVGGMDAVILFFEEMNGAPLNTENARKFIDEMVKRESQGILSGKPAEIAKKLGDGIEAVTRYLMPGDIGFGRADARRWLEGLMINMKLNANDRMHMEESFTSDQVYEMMQAMGPARFVAAMSDTNAGRDALLMMRNMTLERESPIGHAVDVVMKANGVTNLAVSVGIDKYFKYGINLVQLILPFTNTASYLAVKGINWFGSEGRSYTGKLDMDMMNYQMGGNDSFGAGLRKNLIYDSIRFCNTAIMGTLIYLVIQAIGFDEPEDEANKYNWDEYRIGKNIGLGGVDENGEPQGIPVYYAWWLNDLTTFGLPLAYALSARKLTDDGNQKLGEFDSELPRKIFNSGCKSMVDGCSLLDLANVIIHAKEHIEFFERTMEEENIQDYEMPPDFISYSLLQAELACARGVNSLVPNAVKMFMTDSAIVGNEALDRTAYKVYDRDDDTPGKTEPVTSFEEVERRIESKYNIPYAFFNNLTKNKYWRDDGTSTKTGYLFDEMPIATMKDQRRMTWMAMNDLFDRDNIPTESKAKRKYLIAAIEKEMNIIEDNFSTAEDALEHGFMIDPVLRYYMGDYLGGLQNFNWNKYNQEIADGTLEKWSDEANKEYAEVQKENQKIQDYLEEWIFNENMPWTDEGYAKLRSDYQTQYFFKNSSKPATWEDYYLYGKEAVEVRQVPKGNHPTSLSPVTMPETRGRGYNYETKPSWLKDDISDKEYDDYFRSLVGQGKNQPVPMGRDKGLPVNMANFGGTPDIVTDEFTPEDPKSSKGYAALGRNATINYRGYIPYSQNLLNDLYNVDTGWGGLIGAELKKAETSGSSGSTANSASGSNSSSNSSKNNGQGSSKGDGKDSGKDGGKPVNLTADYITALKQVAKAKGKDSSGVLGNLGKYIDKDEWNTDAGKDGNKNKKWPTYGSSKRYRGYGYGGSGSKYQSNPKIYSNPRSLNTDRAATMYSKQPGNPNKNYLRPSFATKGSREAYRREDF